MSLHDDWKLALDYIHTPGRPTRVVWDVDGTLLRDTHRAHLRPLPGGQPAHIDHTKVGTEAIDRYMAPDLVATDEPIREADSLISYLNLRSQAVLATGRFSGLLDVTIASLNKHFPAFRFMQILMRADGDYVTPSHHIKMQRIKKGHSTGYRYCGIWVDDDDEMLDLARSEGFVALKAPDIYEVIRHAKR